MLSETDLRQHARETATLVPGDGRQVDANKLGSFLDSLLSTAESHEIILPHRAAACNLLSTLLIRCSDCSLPAVQTLLWERQVWLRSLDVFLLRYQDCKPKPMRQLLAALSSTLRKHESSSSSAAAIKTHLLAVTSVVFPSRSTTQTPVKPALHVLTFFLEKESLNVPDLESYFRFHITPNGDTSQRPAPIQSMIEEILQWTNYDDLAPSVAPLIRTLLSKAQVSSPAKSCEFKDSLDASKSPAAWVEPVIARIRANPESLENYRHYILSPLFSYSFHDFVCFLQSLHFDKFLSSNRTPKKDSVTTPGSSDRFQENLVFCALLAGNGCGWVLPTDTVSSPQIDTERSIVVVPTVLLGHLLSRQAHSTRVAALSLLVVSTSITRPLTARTFTYLRRGIPPMHADTDANFRSELFGVTQRLIDRLRAVTAALARNTASNTVVLERHIAFLHWYSTFLRMELRPTASYQRHICALKCLGMLLRSGLDSSVSDTYWSKSALDHNPWPFSHNVVGHDTRQLLLDLLLDPFDDVRSTTAFILTMTERKSKNVSDSVAVASQETPHGEQDILLTVLDAAERLSYNSGRADHGDGVAHLYTVLFDRAANDATRPQYWWETRLSVVQHLIEKLEKVLAILESNTAEAVSSHPLHGLLSSIRYILEKPNLYNTSHSFEQLSKWRTLYVRLYDGMQRVWQDTHDILCNDAPEGYMPEELEGDASSLTTKDILSYSWRALKESSLVVRALAVRCPVQSSADALMTSEQLRLLGDLTFVQLVELRHRGAFSTVAQTFLACCTRCMNERDLKPAVKDWYKRALSSIRNTGAINTRRSAGLPALMVGILAAQPDSDMFATAIRELTQEATKSFNSDNAQSEALTQVHALNCLKDIFKNSRLGERSEAYIPSTLELAGNCLSSGAWGIRNAGLMLFRALLDRLLGTNDSYVDDDLPPQTHVSLAKIPNLIDIILRLLSGSSTHPDLQHPGPSQQGVASAVPEGVFPALQLLQRASPSPERLREVQDAVFRLMSSTHWHVRDKAARTYAMLSPADELMLTFEELLKTGNGYQNALHGSLLCVKYVLGRLHALGLLQIPQAFSALSQALPSLYVENACPITRSALVDLHTALSKHSNHDSTPAVSSVLSNPSIELRQLLRTHHHTSWSTTALLRQSLAVAIVYQTQSDPSSVETLHILAERDTNAFVTLLEEAAKVSSKRPHRSREMLAKICQSIILFDQAVQTNSVCDAARRYLLVLASHDDASIILGSSLKDQSLCRTGDSPLSRDSALVFAAISMRQALKASDATQRYPWNMLSTLLGSIRQAIHEDEPVDTRMAAARSLHHISQGVAFIGVATWASPLLLDLCLTVYDLTNDDDDEIRDLAASTASILCSEDDQRNDRSVVPLVAGSRLAAYIVRRYRRDERLVSAAMSRLISVEVSRSDHLANSFTLDESNRQTSTLFAEEKQNLFLDPAREARLWSQVLLRMSRHAFSNTSVQHLTAWTMNSLDLLINKAENENDGALGWTRKPDMFAFGLRVVYAAEVLLALRQKRLPITVTGPEIRRKLVDLLEAGRKSHVNVLWLQEVEKVIVGSLAKGVTGLCMTLGSLLMGLGA